MPKAETLFQQIYEREPTEEDRRRLLATQKAMGLSDDDPTWAMVIAFDYYSQRIASTADDLDNRERQHIDNLKQFYKQQKTDIEKLVEAARERAELAAANEISQQTAQQIENKALQIYEQGRRSSARRAILGWVGGIAAIMAVVIGASWYAIDRHYRQQYERKEAQLRETWSEKLAEIGSSPAADEFQARFPTVINMPEMESFARRLQDTPTHARRLLTLSPGNPYLALSQKRRETINYIIQEGNDWNAFIKKQGTPFPCVDVYKSTTYTYNGHDSTMCLIGYNR
jgi:hypothetical protein